MGIQIYSWDTLAYYSLANKDKSLSGLSEKESSSLQCGVENQYIYASLTLQRVEYREKVNEGQVEGSPGEQGEPPGEAEQDDEASDASHIRHHSPVGGLVLGVLLLDPGQLDHNDNEDHHAQNKHHKEVGHHAHIEGDVITQPTATGGDRQRHRKTYLTTKNNACLLSSRWLFVPTRGLPDFLVVKQVSRVSLVLVGTMVFNRTRQSHCLGVRCGFYGISRWQLSGCIYFTCDMCVSVCFQLDRAFSYWIF